MNRGLSAESRSAPRTFGDSNDDRLIEVSEAALGFGRHSYAILPTGEKSCKFRNAQPASVAGFITDFRLGIEV